MTVAVAFCFSLFSVLWHWIGLEDDVGFEEQPTEKTNDSVEMETQEHNQDTSASSDQIITNFENLIVEDVPVGSNDEEDENEVNEVEYRETKTGIPWKASCLLQF